MALLMPMGGFKPEVLKLAIGEKHTISFSGSPSIGDNWTMYVSKGREFTTIDDKMCGFGTGDNGAPGASGSSGSWSWTFVGAQKGITKVKCTHSYRGKESGSVQEYIYLVDGAEEPPGGFSDLDDLTLEDIDFSTL